MGGKPLNIRKILESIEEREDYKRGIIKGISIPKTNIYNEDYIVEHLSKGMIDKNNIINILLRKKIPISLIGKTANLFENKKIDCKNVVKMSSVFRLIFEKMKDTKHGLIFANVQEIDLYGHSQDVNRCRRTMHEIDKNVDKIISHLEEEDILIITADHGNDSLIGHSFHTREYVPILVIGKKVNYICKEIGIRNTLSDIGCSVCEYLVGITPSYGKSFFRRDSIV